ncbi:tyrosine-type recombinase/integrase [Dysosmobacter welbionis]
MMFLRVINDGEKLAINSVYESLKKMAAEIGRPDARVHDLRHTFAVMSLQEGDDVKTVQSNLGHATASFTLDENGTRFGEDEERERGAHGSIWWRTWRSE